MTSAEPPATLPNGCVQRVSPAGALSETRWVLLAMALTLVVGALAVGWQRHWLPQEKLQAHQIDLATGLTAAEQGIYTDLQAVYDEWRSAGAPLPPPAPQRWAADGWPPFVDDLTAQKRGARQWRLLSFGGRHAYLGVGAEARLSASESAQDGQGSGQETRPRWLLWRLPAAPSAKARDEARAGDDEHEEAFDFWLHEAGSAAEGSVMPSSPESLDETSLIRHGWLQVAAHLKARKK